jgi:outer membrane protein
MKMKQILLNSAFMISICASSLFIYHKMLESKTAYVDIKKVFNSFQMKKELEKKYKQTENERNKVLDSLIVEINILAKHLNEQKLTAVKIEREVEEQFEYKREKYLRLKKQFEADNAALSSKFDQEIVERMNQYIAEYGRNKNYDFIYGADGDGTIMYSNSKYDLSDQVSQFINNKYSGIE